MEQRQPVDLPDGPLLADLRQHLRLALDFELVAAERIALGFNNNRLFRLRAADGRLALAKLYYRDERRRLEREYGLLHFLQRREMPRVPIPLLRCDRHYYAVYSHEPGITKQAADLTTADVREIARCAADLHRIRPCAPGADFPPVANASFSIAAQIAAIQARLQTFHEFASGSDVSAPVRRLCSEIDVASAIEQLLAGAVEGLSAAELGAVIPPEDRRLDSGDFAPHNVLVRPDGGICVVDFENAGWDQPAALTACFLAAATWLDLGREQAGAFLRTYRDAIPQDDTTIERFERFRALMHVFSCAIHLSLTTPAHLARKRFANPDLDLEAITADQVAQFRRRLPLAEAAVAGL